MHICFLKSHHAGAQSLRLAAATNRSLEIIYAVTPKHTTVYFKKYLYAFRIFGGAYVGL